MHNYSHRTFRSQLSTNIRQIFMERIPLEAAKHPFLMHGVLSLSALHLACSRPAQRTKYAYLCDKHQASALTSYRHLLTHITDEVVNALFALSMILSITSLVRATLRARALPEPQFISVDRICELLYLTRGVRDVEEASGERMKNGPFSTVLYNHQLEAVPRATMPSNLLSVFHGLENMIRCHCSDAEQRENCEEAVTHLKSVYDAILGMMASGSGRVLETGRIWRWATMLSYGFIHLLQTKFPPALVITAHFTVACLMLRDLWYVSSWGTLAFHGIRAALKGQLAEHLVWAQEQINTDNAEMKNKASKQDPSIQPYASFGKQTLHARRYAGLSSSDMSDG